MSTGNRTARSIHARPWTSVPARPRAAVAAALESGERPIAGLQLDLDSKLHFADGWLLLTNRRIFAFGPVPRSLGGSEQAAESSAPKIWRFAEVELIRLVETATYATVELGGDRTLLAAYPVTLAQTLAAADFVEQCQAAKLGKLDSELEIEGGLTCPTCGAALDVAGGQCVPCNLVAAPAPVRSLARLTRFARPRMNLLLLGIALTLASNAAGLVPPYLTMPLVDKVLVPFQDGRDVDFGLVPWYLSGLLVAAIFAWLFGWAKTYVVASVGEQISADIRNETYDQLQRLSLDYYGTRRTGDLISRVSNDTERICNFISINLADFTTDLVMIVMTTLALLWINPAMAIVTLLPFPLIAWIIQRVRIRLRHGFARGSAAWAELVNVLADTIPGIRVVKAFAQEKREMARFRGRNQHVLHANNRVNRLWSFFGPTVTFLTDCGLLVIWAFGAWGVVHERITIGVLTAFIAFIGRLYTRLDSMSRMLASTQRAATATHRIFEILDQQPTVKEPVVPFHPGRVSGMIELRDVSFKYGNRRILERLNLAIEPGEMLGLVGPSGAGKSTIVNLICRFYDVSSGVILIDGHDVRSFPIEEYRSNIGMVLQEPYLFYGTIAENIAYAKPHATQEEIIAAAKAGRAHDFILKLPDGYDSLVGERGQSLSGGERQRISIARALLTDPRILILDEATSSVDTETEREIQEAFENLIQGRTTIAIAHRLSTLRRANRLVVLEDGRISAIGLHEELLTTSQTYARLQDSQQAEAINTLGVSP